MKYRDPLGDEGVEISDVLPNIETEMFLDSDVADLSDSEVTFTTWEITDSK